jgi:hypothetical protein
MDEPSRFMRASIDSIDSTVRPFTFSFARSSSSALTPSSRSLRSSPPMTSIAWATLSGRVPTYMPIWTESMYWLEYE